MPGLGRYLWTLPNTALGLLFLPLAWCRGGGVQVVNGVIEIYGPAAAALLTHAVWMKGGASAITLGHVVLGRDRALLDTTRRHERVHVRQYELWGPAFIPAYLLASAWAAVRGESAYLGNYFERQAYRPRSFHPQRDYRVDTRGATCRNEGGDETAGGE